MEARPGLPPDTWAFHVAAHRMFRRFVCCCRVVLVNRGGSSSLGVESTRKHGKSILSLTNIFVDVARYIFLVLTCFRGFKPGCNSDEIPVPDGPQASTHSGGEGAHRCPQRFHELERYRSLRPESPMEYAAPPGCGSSTSSLRDFSSDASSSALGLLVPASSQAAFDVGHDVANDISSTTRFISSTFRRKVDNIGQAGHYWKTSST